MRSAILDDVTSASLKIAMENPGAKNTKSDKNNRSNVKEESLRRLRRG